MSVTTSKQGRPLCAVNRQALAAVWSSKVPTKRIADSLGVRPRAVRLKALGLGLPPRERGMTLRRGDNALFKRLWGAGLSEQDIATLLGYTNTSSVRSRRSRLGPPSRGTCAGRITLAEWRELEYARQMAEAAPKDGRKIGKPTRADYLREAGFDT